MESSIKLVSGWQQRLLLIAIAVLILFGVVGGFCWFLANSIAANAQQPDLVVAAIRLSPSDPLAHAQLATFKTRSFVATDLPEALDEFERSVALSPNDYRYWFALTRMRERIGDTDGAERAARRTVELAPNYAQVLWLEGNILLRRGEQKEAFAQMRRAAEADPQFAIHFVNAVAQTIQTDDTSYLRQTVGDSVSVRSALISYLVQAKKLDAAVNVWEQLPDKEKREIGKALSKALLDAKKYRAALPFYALMAANENEKPLLGRFLNGDFEYDMTVSDANPFVWQIAAGAQPQIAPFASTKHSGARSLIIIFNSPTSANFRSVAQTIAVENNTQYHFEAFVSTEKLQSGSAVYWEMIDVADNRVLAKTQDIPTGNNDWQKLAADFKTNGTTEAVTFRLTQTACSQPPCPTTGKIWFDDFTLQKIN
ncbi:MAG: carbohydrate binding domain-containing protein [Pyrinomonadaceae bacterium]